MLYFNQYSFGHARAPLLRRSMLASSSSSACAIPYPTCCNRVAKRMQHVGSCCAQQFVMIYCVEMLRALRAFGRGFRSFLGHLVLS